MPAVVAANAANLRRGADAWQAKNRGKNPIKITCGRRLWDREAWAAFAWASAGSHCSRKSLFCEACPALPDVRLMWYVTEMCCSTVSEFHEVTRDGELLVTFMVANHQVMLELISPQRLQVLCGRSWDKQALPYLVSTSLCEAWHLDSTTGVRCNTTDVKWNSPLADWSPQTIGGGVSHSWMRTSWLVRATHHKKWYERIFVSATLGKYGPSPWTSTMLETLLPAWNTLATDPHQQRHLRTSISPAVRHCIRDSTRSITKGLGVSQPKNGFNALLLFKIPTADHSEKFDMTKLEHSTDMVVISLWFMLREVEMSAAMVGHLRLFRNRITILFPTYKTNSFGKLRGGTLRCSCQVQLHLS